MDEHERRGRVGDDPLHVDALDEPTIDRIPDPGSEFHDLLVRGTGDPRDEMGRGTSLRAGLVGAWVDPVAGETATGPDPLADESPESTAAHAVDDEAITPEAAGGAIGAFGGMVVGSIVAGPPGSPGAIIGGIIGGIVGAVTGVITGGAVAAPDPASDALHDDPTVADEVRRTGDLAPPDEEVRPVDELTDPRLR